MPVPAAWGVFGENEAGALSLPALGNFRPMPAMKLVRVLLACVLLPACAATLPQQPPGMPLDKELLPNTSDEALTKR
jgi:hypothetical protein